MPKSNSKPAGRVPAKPAHALVTVLLLATGIACVVVANAVAGETPAGAARFATASMPAPRPKGAELSPQALYLIRSTLAALDDANRTGNYTVLRDLASPSFQAANSAADMAVAFTDLRRRNVDLGGVVLAAPKLTEPAVMEAGRHMRLVGQLAPGASQVLFDLRFEAIGGHWRLAAISVGTALAKP